MGMYAVDAADGADLAELGTSARDGRAASVSRRRQLSQGNGALNGGGNGTAAAAGGGATPTAEEPAAASNGPGASNGPNGQGASNGTQGAPGVAAAAAADGVASAHLGRAVSMERRRQLSQGKQALNGGGDRTAAAAGARARTFIVHRGGAR